MSKRDWRLFIADISGMTYEEYMKDNKMKDAIVRNLEIIGEAVVSNFRSEKSFNSRLFRL